MMLLFPSFKFQIQYNHDNWDKIRNEKLQYDINRDAGKELALSSKN